MSRTSAAVSEITRVAWWSLRALGCPLGAVERMAKVLALSEILEGECLAALRQGEAQLTASFKAKEPQFTRKSAEYGVVDAKGRTFLDIGPRAVDVLTGIARSGNTVRIRVHGAADRLGLAGICVLAAQRNVSVLSIKPGSEVRDRLEWAMYLPALDRVWRVSGTTDAGESDIYRTLQSLAASGAAFPVFPGATQPIERQDMETTVDLIGFAPGEVPVSLQDVPSALQVLDVTAALRDAYAHGVEVQACDLRFLYELETRTWAPSSERSRTQAGFGGPHSLASPSAPG